MKRPFSPATGICRAVALGSGLALLMTSAASAQEDAKARVCGVGPSSEMRAALNALNLCVKAWTISLERSGEAPESIATAALSQCGPERDKLSSMARSCASIMDAPNMANVPALAEKQARERAVATVVQMRAENPRSPR